MDIEGSDLVGQCNEICRILISKLEKETDAAAIRAISNALEHFVVRIDELDSKPNVELLADLKRDIADLKSWRELVRNRLGVQSFSMGPVEGLGRI